MTHLTVILEHRSSQNRTHSWNAIPSKNSLDALDGELHHAIVSKKWNPLSSEVSRYSVEPWSLPPGRTIFVPNLAERQNDRIAQLGFQKCWLGSIASYTQMISHKKCGWEIWSEILIQTKWPRENHQKTPGPSGCQGHVNARWLENDNYINNGAWPCEYLASRSRCSAISKRATRPFSCRASCTGPSGGSVAEHMAPNSTIEWAVLTPHEGRWHDTALAQN